MEHATVGVARAWTRCVTQSFLGEKRILTRTTNNNWEEIDGRFRKCSASPAAAGRPEVSLGIFLASPQDIGGVVVRARVSVIVLFINYLVLISTQGRQILILLGEDGRWIWIWFAIASIWLATNAWYWPRFILSGPLPPIEDDNDQRRTRRENARVGTVRRVPRVIGAATFVLLASAFLVVSGDVPEWARWRLYLAAGLLIATAVVFYAAVIVRRRFLHAVEAYPAGHVPVGVLVPLMSQIVQSMQPLAKLTGLRPITTIFVWLNYIVTVILFLGAYLMP